MPRSFEDDRDDPRPQSRSSPTPLVPWLAIGGALVVLLAACGGGALWLLGARRQAAREADERIAAQVVAEQRRLDAAGGRAGPNPSHKGAAARSPLTRREVEAAVRGKTRDEVTAAVGRPDDIREGVPGEDPRPAGGAAPRDDWWVFRGRVTDLDTGRPYPEVRVRFGPDGTADRFEYH